MSKSDDALVRALSPLCEGLGVDCYDVELVSGVLRMTVTRDTGIDIDALAEVTRTVSAYLDEHDDVAPAGRYELEVSTPGVERRLRTAEHLAGAVGERVAVRLRPGIEGPRRFEGTLSSVDQDGFCVTLEDGTTATIALGDLERARTVFDWRRAFAEDKQERRAGEVAGADTRRKVARS